MSLLDESVVIVQQLCHKCKQELTYADNECPGCMTSTNELDQRVLLNHYIHNQTINNLQQPSVPIVAVAADPSPVTHSQQPTVTIPVGIFWDIENLQVPTDRSAIQLVERIRRLCFERKYRESEFLVVCDTYKTNPKLLNDLNAAQVTVIHVNGMAKNAADDKLRQQIQRFVDLIGNASAVVMLTDDVNFAPVLSDLRNRRGVEINLIQRQAGAALKTSANFVLNFVDFCKDLDLQQKFQTKEFKVLIKGLPTNRRSVDIVKRLQQMVTNCGGRKVATNPSKGEATIQFACADDARRCQQRLNNHNVFGHRIEAVVLGDDWRPQHRGYQNWSRGRRPAQTRRVSPVKLRDRPNNGRPVWPPSSAGVAKAPSVASAAQFVNHRTGG